MTTFTWHLAPHDPLVLGTGRRLPATLPRMSHALPLPATLAGAVRARFADGANDLSPDEATKLLDQISLRGPWLQRGDTVLVRAPLHVRAHQRDVLYPTLTKLAQGEGVYRPAGAEGIVDFAKIELAGAHKLSPLNEFVSLDVACNLLLGACAKLPDAGDLAEFEGRVHVSINAESQTAEPAALFSSSGVRYGDDVTIGVEVTGPHDASKSLERVFVLGGESRVVARREGKGFPDFSTVRRRYEEALKRHPGEAPLLLLMLATPASYSTSEHDLGAGWIPPWLTAKGEVDGLSGLRFELVSIATDRFVPVSGWSLATRPNGATQGVQRAVRRLVPAGTVYALRVVGGGADAYLRACERFWWRPIDESVSGNAGAHLAAPHRDGYGLVLPGLWWPTQRR